MAQQLRIHTRLAEDLSLVRARLPVSPVPSRFDTAHSEGTVLTHAYTRMCTHNEDIFKKKKKLIGASKAVVGLQVHSTKPSHCSSGHGSPGKAGTVRTETHTTP